MSETTNTPQGQELQPKGANTPVLEITEDYTKIPNSVLFSQSLSGNAKVAFGVLYHTYTWAVSQGKLNEDGSFYCATSRISERMDVSEKTVGETVIPALINAGLITKCKERQDVNGKETNRYIINFANIQVYEGEPDAEKEARKSQRGRRAYEGRNSKELAIMGKYEASFIYLTLCSPYEAREHSKKLASHLIQEYRYAPTYVYQLIKRLTAKMMEHPDKIEAYMLEQQRKRNAEEERICWEHKNKHRFNSGWDDDEEENYNDRWDEDEDEPPF